MSCLYVSELTGKELLCQFTYYTVYNCHLLILNRHFFSENRKDGTQWWKIFQSVGVIMIRLGSPTFFSFIQYEFRHF